MNTTNATAQRMGYELRFRSLFLEGRGYAFPCDAEGRVEIDRLNARARQSYWQVREAVGRDVATPTVQVC